MLEPIFEAMFLECSYGYRSGRSAKDATVEVRKWLNFGLENVVDADIHACFDEIPHHRLLEAVARRVSDGSVLRTVKLWLRSGVMVGGGVVEATEEGTPPGGVISPLLCNIYLQRRLLRRRRNRSGLGRYKDLPDGYFFEKLGLFRLTARGSVRYATRDAA